jgi:hypothetical protein
MPGVGSGLGGQFGIAAETSYGLYAPPAKFLEIRSTDLKKIKNTVQGGGLAAGRPAQLGARRKVTTTAAAGGVTLEVTNKLMGLFFQALMGGTVAPVQQGATAAYLQTHPLTVDSAGKSLTMQVGVPLTDATTAAMTYKGCKILSVEFTCDRDGELMANVQIDARELDETQTLAVAAFTSGVVPLPWNISTLKLGTYGAEAAVDFVNSVSVKIERSMKTDRFYVGNGGKKSEPITNDWVKVSGTFNADFGSKATFADRFSSDTPVSMVWEFIGPIIAGAFPETFRIKTPMLFLDGDTPTLDGADVTTTAFPWVAQLDGTNPLSTIEYISTDPAL